MTTQELLPHAAQHARPLTTLPHLTNAHSQLSTTPFTARAPTTRTTIAHRQHTQSHDDPGWVRTADQYFDHFVKHMYTTVVSSLASHPHRRFQAVEMVYLKQWYADERGGREGERQRGRSRG